MYVRKSVSTSSFGATFDIIAFVKIEQILSEYCYNRNLLMSNKKPHFQNSKKTLSSLLSILYCFNIPTFISKRPLGFYFQFFARKKEYEH